MKLPKSPPSPDSLWSKFSKPAEMRAIISAVSGPSAKGKYLHWDELIHRAPPEGLTAEQWWFGLKFHRETLGRNIPLRDRQGAAFQFSPADPIPEQLHQIDQRAGGFIQMPEQVTNPELRDQYYVGSLMEEAITSSQLEGASTTRPVAKEMLRSGRPPRDKSEQMILNNFLTMQSIQEFKSQELSPEVVFQIHRRITERTLDDPTAAGRFRRDDERVVVGDDFGEVFHDPPPAAELTKRLEAMCEFANGRTPDTFIHPVLRSILLHFWLAYDHPFVDGNGRSARALFYWSMLRHGYWLCEFVSISQLILKAPVQYGRAFLHTETDENDLTYFILHQLDVLVRAVQELHKYIERKTRQLQETQARLRGVEILNHRQRALVEHALRHPGQRYTIAGHRASHNVVYQTARVDLFDLVARGLLSQRKISKTYHFVAVPELESRLRSLK